MSVFDLTSATTVRQQNKGHVCLPYPWLGINGLNTCKTSSHLPPSHGTNFLVVGWNQHPGSVYLDFLATPCLCAPWFYHSRRGHRIRMSLYCFPAMWFAVFMLTYVCMVWCTRRSSGWFSFVPGSLCIGDDDSRYLHLFFFLFYSNDPRFPFLSFW